MQELPEFVQTIIYSAGVSASLMLVVGWLTRTWLEKRLAYDYQRQIAELNARLKQQSDVSASQLNAGLERINSRLQHSAQVSTEVLKAVIQKRVLAVEEIWRVTLQVEGTIPAFFLMFDIGLESEYPSIVKRPDVAAELSRLDHRDVIQKSMNLSPELGLYRPFAGSYLWAVFWTYRAVVFRMIYLIDESKKEPSKIYWYKDELLRKHICASLGNDALEEFDGLEISRISWINKNFSKAVIDASDKVIEGREAGESAMRQAERMEKLLM